MDTNELVEQLLRGDVPPEVLLSPLSDATAASVIERLQQEVERYWYIDLHRSLEFANRIVAIGRARSDPHQEALGMLACGDALKLLGRMDEASEAFELARNMLLAAGDEVGQEHAPISSLSRLLAQRNVNLQAQAKVEAEGDSAISLQRLLLRIDSRIAGLYKQMGDHLQAVHHYQTAIATAETLGENQYLTHLYMNLGFTYIALGDAPQALANLEHARRTLSIAGNQKLETLDCHNARKSLKDMLLGRALESVELQQAEAHVVTCPFCQLRLQLLALEILMKPEGTCSVWRDQLHDYVEAQLTGHEENPEFMDLRRHLDACVDCAEAYALLYETMWAEQQGAIPEPPTMPTLDTSFLSSKPAADPSQDGLLDRLRNAYQTDDPIYFELFRRAIRNNDERAWQMIIVQYQPLVAEWVDRWMSQHPDFPLVSEERQDFIAQAFQRFWISFTVAKFEKAQSLPDILKFLQMCVQGAIIAAWRKLSSIHLELETWEDKQEFSEPEPSPENLLQKDEFWQLIRKKSKDLKEYIVMYASFSLNQSPREILSEYPDEFSNIEEIYQYKANVLARLARDQELKEFARPKHLRKELYRNICPTPMELGVYHLGLLPESQALVVAQHLRECSLCRREVMWIYNFET